MLRCPSGLLSKVRNRYMEDNRRYIVMLTEILEKQLAVLEQMADITSEQERIADDTKFDEEAFEETLTKKDVLIMQFNELDNGFVSVYSRIKSELHNNGQLYKQDISGMQELIRRCTDKGNEIRTMELRNRDKLERCFAMKKKEYSAKQTAATVVGKYNQTMKNVNFMNQNTSY